MSRERERWIQPLRAGAPAGASRLCCFPHAGGSATAFHRFARLLDPSVEVVGVQYPGRGGRLSERSFTDLEALARACVDALAAARWIEGGDYGLLGFSFGAAVGFAAARELRRRQLPGPRFLALGGRVPPGTCGPVDLSRLAALDDRAFIAALVGHYGDPDGLLQHPEIVAMILPALRADLAALGAWTPSDERPFDAPIVAFAGREDPSVSASALEGWARHTTARFRSFTIPGRHFVLDSEAHEVAEEVSALLRSR